jgi:cytochrome c oxidase subunit 3
MGENDTTPDKVELGQSKPEPHGGHPPFLAHHFATPQQQFAAGKLGMWIFLLTEILLFGGLFCAYAVYRSIHPEIFQYAHQFLDKTLGAVNTAILITSSLTMAWAVRCAQLGQRRLLPIMLSLTLLGACGFLGIKYVEYKHKWEAGLLWARQYQPIERAETSPSADHPAATAPSSERSHAPRNVGIFFSIYFLMTGLHGIHVIAGMTAIGWLLVRSLKGHFGPLYFGPVDNVGLYWHLVDLIWIYLFPLLYLIH